MKPEELVQRSDAWWAYRAGKVTASRLYDVTKTINKGAAYSTKRANYLNELVGEIITGRAADMKDIPSLNGRAQLEPDARAAYEFYTGNPVKEVGCIPHPKIDRLACSPDGLVGRDGGMEIKALDAPNHLRALQNDRAILAEYAPQCVGNLACSRRKWWDLVFFNPYMPEELKLHVVRIDKDKEAIALLESAVIDFIAEAEEKVRQILKK